MGFGSPGEGSFQRTANSELDLDRYNVDFFRRYEAGLLDLQALGIEADLILFHPYDSREKKIESLGWWTRKESNLQPVD
jgi:hypothetical protein